MGWQVTVYTAPMLGAALISALLAVIAFRSRGQRTALPLAGVLVGTAIWCGANGLQISSTTVEAKIFWRSLRFLGTTIAVPSVFFFAAAFTNRDHWLTRQRVTLVLIPEVLINLAVWTNAYHGLFRTGATIRTDLGYRALAIDFGPLFIFEAAYQYVLLAAMTYWLIDEFRRSRRRETGVYQSQAGLVLIAILIPWVVNVSFVTGLTVTDLTPLGFVATGVLFAVGFFRYHILDLVPIARSTVVDNINEGYLVLNTENVVVDANETAADIMDTPKALLVGERFQSLFGEFSSVLDRFEDTRDIHEQIALERDGYKEYFDVTVSGIYNRRDHYIGRVVLFRDVTEQEKRKRQLEQQNERLDEFAQIVSHDLRNPLSVARGRIALVEDDEQAQIIERSLDRMETIIDDTLTLARHGQTIEETERVDLRQLCKEAWRDTETMAATAEFPVDRTVEGHRGRLRQVFENFFRNALDHGDESVTVTVGDITGGFYIADSGPGIPEAEREQVLKKGYTTADDGTGFGLSIVDSAIEAHGWELAVTESETGGARFEITGIDTAIPADD